MAIVLKESYGVDSFCALVATRESLEFLKEQTDIPYTSLILDEDLHAAYVHEKVDHAYIDMLEKEYGIPNLWPYLMSDRILMKGQFLREYPYDHPPYTHDELLRILQANARGIISFLEQEKPDMIFFSVVGNLASHLLYAIAKKKGIRVQVGELGRFPEQYMVYEDYQNFKEVRERFNELIQGTSIQDNVRIEKARALVEDFRARPRPYAQSDSILKQDMTRMQHLKFLSPIRFLRSVYWLVRRIKDYATYPKENNYTSINPFYYFVDKIKRKARIFRGYEDLYDEIDLQENFVYFPLNYEPEISLFLYAPFHSDQAHLVKQVARSLPVGYTLYVKEHPTMVGYRPRSFYHEIKKMPNVKLIRPHTLSFTLLEHTKLVTTITGTGGWEALLFKKPSITFGYNFYNSAPMVKHSTAIDELPYLIDQQLHHFTYNEEHLLLFISAVLEHTADIDMVHLWHDSPPLPAMEQGVAPLVDLLARNLGLTRLS